MTAKDEQKTRTHDEILASAGRLLRARGIAAASVADVMAGAGLTVGGFYAHFASKGALVDAVVRRATTEMRARWFEGLDDAGPDARFQTVIRRYLSRSHRDEVGTGCVLPAVVGEAGRTGGVEPATLADAIAALERELGEQTRGAATPSRARPFVLGLIALCYGGLTLSRALRGTPLSDDVLRACREFARLARRALLEDATAAH